jgi:hypothetical protein
MVRIHSGTRFDLDFSVLRESKMIFAKLDQFFHLVGFYSLARVMIALRVHSTGKLRLLHGLDSHQSLKLT